MDDPRILILESKGRFIEAAEVQISRGNLTRAFQLLLKNPTNEDAIRRAADIALEHIWKECSFGMPVQAKLQQKSSHARHVLDSIRKIPLKRLSISDRDQVCLRY